MIEPTLNKDYGLSNLTVIEHPLVKAKMARLRNEETPTKQFRELVTELSILVGYEATKHLGLKPVDVKTPVNIAHCETLADRHPVLIPILRAGLGMVEGYLTLMPSCKVGHLGMYRNEETFEPVPYYANYPHDIGERATFLLDPMLATGGSAASAIEYIKGKGARDISLSCIVAARPGVEYLLEHHPDVRIYAASFDEKLTPKAYIDPGLGDAGDRLFGTL